MGNKRNIFARILFWFQNTPILYSNRFFHIVNFGLFSALNAITILLVFFYYLGLQGIEPNSTIIWMLPLSAIFVWLGARFMHIISLGREFFSHPGKYLMQTGFFMQGGIVGAILWTLLFSHVAEVPLSVVWDSLAMGALVGQVFGRIGCFNYGCCYGKPTKSLWGSAYTNPLSKILRINPQLTGVPVHPAQLYKAFSNLVVFILLVILFPLPNGVVSIVFFLYHGISRVAFEYFRSDLFLFSKRLWISTKFAMISLLFGLSLFLIGPLVDQQFFENKLLVHPQSAVSFLAFLYLNPLLGVVIFIIGGFVFLGYGIHGRSLGTIQFTKGRTYENKSNDCRSRSIWNKPGL